MTIRRGAQGRDFDFLIVGGGITGCVMASLLVNRKLAAPGRVAIVADGAQPALVPSVADSEWDLRVFALSRASQRLLTICGAWQLLPTQKYNAYERMCVWDARGGPPRGGAPRGGAPAGLGSLSFDCAELGEPNLGYIVEGRALQAACRRAATAAGAVFIDAGISEILVDEAHVRVSLSDDRDLQGQLLIAADGADSTARKLLGIDTAGHAYHQDALVAHVRTAISHRNTAWQRFLPLGPLAFLPLPDGRSSIVWSTARPEALRLRSLDAAAFGAELERASGEVLGACEVTTPIASFPLKLQYALDYARPRAVLVGDAAHAVHPLAGQGLNLGLLDCAVLAEVLGGDSRDVGGADLCGPARFGEHKLLRRYERRRKSENVLAATMFDGLERLFSNDNTVLARLRVAGLAAVGRVPFVKRELASRALGLSGDVPAFLRAGSD
ncbi:MAG TPA: FAD-dependent monooxygenase [Steroidobacteraceae bacterium]|nr:FAD-dependent monooxygenase [Steroidobacteraceae bacterium]